MTYQAPDPIEVGRRVRSVREYHNLNQKDFAASVRINNTSLGLIERGDKVLKADMAFRIAERYGVSMDFLYRGRLTELPAKLADSLMQNLTARDE